MHQPLCECEQPTCPGDTGKFYVTVRRDNGDYRALLGPYATHAEALANVSRGTNLATDFDPRACWYAYGTARTEPTIDTLPTIFGR